MNTHVSDITNVYPRWLANLGLFLAITMCLFLFWEWLSIDVLHDSDKIKAYNFGSGSMLEKGGNDYMSALIYARTALVGAIASVPGILAFWATVKKPSSKSMLLAYSIWLVSSWIASSF